MASGARSRQFVVNTDAGMNRIISAGSNTMVGSVRTWRIIIRTSGVRIRLIVVISDVWMSWIISDGRVNEITGMVVCRSVSVKTCSHFLPQPVNLLVSRGPVQTNVLSAEAGLSIRRPGTGLRRAGS